MPRFFFHLRSPTGLERDDIGLDLDGVEAAYLGAYAAIPEMTLDLLREKANPYQHAFEIMDAAGNLLMEVLFSEVLNSGQKASPPQRNRQWQKAQAEMDRTERLIASIHVEQAALLSTLAETKRLLAESRQVLGRT
jgi:hypothetical protein